MNKYLVVSYDDDQQQWFYDMVLAASKEQAEEYICKVRDYVIAADATRPENFNFDLPGLDASVPASLEKGRNKNVQKIPISR